MGQVVARTGAIYGRWIAANGWSEALGLGTTLALGWRIAPSPRAGDRGPDCPRGGAGRRAHGHGIGGRGGGCRAGRRRAPRTADALPALLGARHRAGRRHRLVQYPLAAALGLVTGPILGLAQWFVLRRYVAHARPWLRSEN